MIKTRISEFRHTISIYERVAGSSDGLGHSTPTPTLIVTTRAAIWPVSAKEARENMRYETNISHNIRIFYQSGISEDMYITFGARTFEIKGIINVEERNVYLDLICNENK